jgi:hypothetical protein
MLQVRVSERSDADTKGTTPLVGTRLAGADPRSVTPFTAKPRRRVDARTDVIFDVGSATESM